MNVDIISAFSSPIASFNYDKHEDIQNDLIKYCYQLREEDSGGVTASNINGWQSGGLECPDILLPVIDSVNELVEYMINQQLYCHEHGKMWVNINGKGSSNQCHQHPGADFAAIYYVKVPPDADCGTLLIENPNTFSQYQFLQAIAPDMQQHTNTSTFMSLMPKPGDFVIFPSNLVHSVTTNNVDDDRISIAWNIKINEK
tara:strand:+ start:117 stop:716 length:600 start_codon:yes stop_codon:yes gene_type:complete